MLPFFFLEALLIYTVSFRCTAEWFSSHTHTHSFLDSSPLQVVTKYWVWFPVWFSTHTHTQTHTDTHRHTHTHTRCYKISSVVPCAVQYRSCCWSVLYIVTTSANPRFLIYLPLPPLQKTKIMASGPIASWKLDGETVDTVSDFIFFSSKITADGDCSHEIKRHLLLGRKIMTNLDSILKSRDITLPTKVKAMVFPEVLHGCES